MNTHSLPSVIERIHSAVYQLQRKALIDPNTLYLGCTTYKELTDYFAESPMFSVKTGKPLPKIRPDHYGNGTLHYSGMRVWECFERPLDHVSVGVEELPQKP